MTSPPSPTPAVRDLPTADSIDRLLTAGAMLRAILYTRVTAPHAPQHDMRRYWMNEWDEAARVVQDDVNGASFAGSEAS